MTQPTQRRGHGFRRFTWAALLAATAGALAGCQAFRVGGSSEKETPPPTAGKSGIPGKHSIRVSQYVFYSNFPLREDQPLFRELSDLRDQVYRELQLPPSNTVVQVFLFEDKAAYDSYMSSRYRDLPWRPAYFISQPRVGGGADELLVYTYWGDRVRQDLRHELTHALLHSVLKDVPLWLDEGLAEYFELPPELRGVNPKHLDDLRREPVQPDLARLESLSEVGQMNRAEYREAWAWVHMMLRGKPEARTVLLNYLQQLRGPAGAKPLLPKLQQVHPDLNAALAEHLVHTEVPRVARAARKR